MRRAPAPSHCSTEPMDCWCRCLSRTEAGLRAILIIPERRNWIMPPIFCPLTHCGGSISMPQLSRSVPMTLPSADSRMCILVSSDNPVV